MTIKAHDEQDQLQVGIAEAHNDGSASATATGVASKANRIKSDVDHSGVKDPQNNKLRGNLTINFGHSDFDDSNLRDPKLWAGYMDRSLRAGLREASHKKLGGNKFIRTTNLVPLGMNYLLCTQLLGFSPEAALLVYSAHRNSTVPMLDQLLTGHPTKLSHFEFSSLAAIGIPYDRMALASLYTQTRRFAKVKK